MNGKTYEHYYRAYSFLDFLLKDFCKKTNRNFIAPLHISVDAEQARINALKEI